MQDISNASCGETASALAVIFHFSGVVPFWTANADEDKD